MECRLCGGSDLTLYYTQGDRDQFRFYRCQACGLVNRAVPADELDGVVDRYVKSLLGSGPGALATCKRMVRNVADMPLDKAGPFTAEMIAVLRMSDEGQEGMAAFLERREPSWRHKPAKSE